ncbi:hypothetical protein AGDE_14215 [Angomonas deanei]|uniref:Uncharacterized protein n=1 Tax=Angomonas deanei TaxID=59799 RepID=A0A7G2CNH7_9TRYP|nr:hypothetical protein AGDE_14215 [Angomonas deanei]CAD2221015.1 hypothetical protein, conserved [Angomonas deanei]|eukprot:EPY21238.1 hypothetical protein AGDE_14215 [Angomonas deanei]
MSAAVLPDSPQRSPQKGDSAVKTFSRCHTANPFTEVLALSATKSTNPTKAAPAPKAVKRELFGRSKSSFSGLPTAGQVTPSTRTSTGVLVTSPPPRTPSGAVSKTNKGKTGLAECSTSDVNVKGGKSQRASTKLKGAAKQEEAKKTGNKGSKTTKKKHDSGRLSQSLTSGSLNDTKSFKHDVPLLDLSDIKMK